MDNVPRHSFWLSARLRHLEGCLLILGYILALSDNERGFLGIFSRRGAEFRSLSRQLRRRNSDLWLQISPECIYTALVMPTV